MCLCACTHLRMHYPAHVHVCRSHVFLMSQYRSAFQIKIMGSRARVNERERGRGAWSMVSIGGASGGGGTFLRPDVGGKLKISLAAWRGSKEADTHRSVRELAADPVSAHSRPIMLPVMCVQPPFHAPPPPCLPAFTPLATPARERKLSKSRDQTSNQTLAVTHPGDD